MSFGLFIFLFHPPFPRWLSVASLNDTALSSLEIVSRVLNFLLLSSGEQ